MVDPHAFMDALREFHHSQGEDLKAPIFNRKVMDLKKLWELVYAHGGSSQVCLKKRWAAIGRCFNPPTSMTNLSFHIKRIFEKYLLPFEQLHFPARAMNKVSETSSQSSSGKKIESVSPAFSSAIYIPKKRRSKLSRESRFAKKKKIRPLSNTLEPEGKRNRPQTKTIDPKVFAIPQTLVRPSTALSINDYEIQAVSALREMKSLPRITNPTPTVENLFSSELSSKRVFDDNYTTPGNYCAPKTTTPEDCWPKSTLPLPTVSLDCISETYEGSNDIYLSNGIRVIPVKPSGGVEASMDCEIIGSFQGHKRMTTLDETDIRLTNIESRQSHDNERLSLQMQQIQSLVLRQEAKLQSVEASFGECKQYLQAIFSGLRHGGISLPLNGNIYLAPPKNKN